MSSSSGPIDDDRNTRISTDVPFDFTNYVSSQVVKAHREEQHQHEEEGEGEEEPMLVKRKRHLPVNLSMTQRQIDFIAEKANGVKISVWHRRLIQKVYPDFPDMEDDNNKNKKSDQVVTAREN